MNLLIGSSLRTCLYVQINMRYRYPHNREVFQASGLPVDLWSR